MATLPQEHPVGRRLTPSWLDLIWHRRAPGFVVPLVVAAGFGFVSAWLTPRGPVTTTEALAAMASALLIGLACGMVSGSRWSMLYVPAVFMVAFEIGRQGTTGPTVDGIHLTSLYGAIAFVVGRLVHGVLVLAPMLLGTIYGIELASRLGRAASPSLGITGWTLSVLGTIALAGVAIVIARPVSMHPIVGPGEGSPPNSIAELIRVPIGGHAQAMMIRGQSRDNPVLLYLAGGPGGSDLGAMRRDVTLEEDFVVVTWEQRGVGKSYGALDPTETLTLEQMIADTLEVTNYLRDRFGEDRVYLVGNSWGSTLGVLAVQRQPELFHAFVGTGQMVSQRQTDIMFYEDTLAWAEQTGNAGLGATLSENGPPPYKSLLDYEPALSHEHDWNVYPEFDASNEMPAILFVPENSWMDRINGFRSFLDTFSVLYPQLQGIDFRRDVPRLEVPFYMVLGKHEARGRAVLAEEWFEMVDAPYKERIIFEHSGHRAQFDQPGDFAALMRRIKDVTGKGSS
jgi:proline iminopeptidase